MNITKRLTALAVALGLLAVLPTVLAQGQPQAPILRGQASQDVLLHALVGGSLFLPVKRDPVQQQKNRDCRAADAQGEALLRTGDAKAAIDSFLRALTFVPADVLTYEHLARAYEVDGQTEQAITTYRTLLYHRPNMGTSADTDSSLLMRFALALLKTGQREEALRVYQRAHQFLPTDRGPLPPLFTSSDFNASDFSAAAYTSMGLYEMQGGDADPVVEFSRAIATQPRFATAYFYRGVMFKGKTGRAAEAMTDLSRAQQFGGPEMKPFVDKQLKEGSAEFTAVVKAAGFAAQ